MELLLFVLAIFAIYTIYTVATSEKRDSEHKNTPTSTRTIETEIIPTTPINTDQTFFAWPELFEYDFEVVGESFYQPALATLAEINEDISPQDIKPFKAYLIPEDNNQYDNKAMRVDINGMQVGYLSRDDARSFRRRLSGKKLTGQITTCNALLTGGHIRNGQKTNYGVILDMKPFD